MKLGDWLCLLLLVLGASCNPEVDIYAPERELYAVYGVLNPKSSQQLVSVTKVFQSEGDPGLYAATNDLSARGLNVELHSDSTVLRANLIEIPDSMSGLFPLTTGVYQFQTTGADVLKPGERYDLLITKPDEPEFRISAHTEIPTAPILISPEGPYYSAMHQTFTYPTIDFSEEVGVTFRRGTGIGFEIRVYVKFWDGSTERTAMWGPTPIFLEPKRCQADLANGQMCRIIPKRSVTNALHSVFADFQPDTVYVHDTVKVAHVLDLLSKKSWLEVTCVDSALTYYLYANNPFGFGTNMLIDKQEYSNISGDNIGIFGSINTTFRYFFLGSCSRWLAGLRGAQPTGCDR
ncbi:MAG: DUF4249 family protein [Bacteroidetes bacterium]|nr:DUF4249 family protein [Bacteroidota bacterium]